MARHKRKNPVQELLVGIRLQYVIACAGIQRPHHICSGRHIGNDQNRYFHTDRRLFYYLYGMKR